MNSLNVPKLRFPGFDGEWEIEKFGKIATNKSGKFNPIKENSFTKCIELEHLETGTGQLLGFIDGSNSGSIKNKFNEGDVLFGKLRPYLKKYLQAPFEGVCSSEIWVLKGVKITNSFLYQIVQTNKFIDIANQSSGSKMPRADWNVVENCDFTFPTLPEQQKIASFLSAVDEKVQQLSRKKELLKQYKKGVMQQLFSGKLRFKDENGKVYADWEEKKLGDVLKIGSGKDYKHLEKGTIPVFGTGGYMLSVNKFLHSGETVFIGRKGTIDKPFYFNGEFWTVDTLFYTHTFKNAIPKFIYCVFQQINWKLHNEASGVPSLSKSTIEKLKFDFPCLEEQQKIANFLSGIDGKIEQVNGELVKTQEFKKGLLQQLFV